MYCILSLCYRKGSGRRGRGGASSRRGKGPANDDQEVDNSPATSGASLKDQAAELLANQFLTVPSAGDGPSTSGQIQTQFVRQLLCLSFSLFFSSLPSLSLSLSLSLPPPPLSFSLYPSLHCVLHVLYLHVYMYIYSTTVQIMCMYMFDVLLVPLLHLSTVCYCVIHLWSYVYACVHVRAHCITYTNTHTHTHTRYPRTLRVQETTAVTTTNLKRSPNQLLGRRQEGGSRYRWSTSRTNWEGTPRSPNGSQISWRKLMSSAHSLEPRYSRYM